MTGPNDWALRLPVISPSRESQIDSVVRAGLSYWADRYGSQPDYLASQVLAEPNGILAIQVADATWDAWREQGITSGLEST